MLHAANGQSAYSAAACSKAAVRVTFGGLEGQVWFVAIITPGVLQVSAGVPEDAEVGDRVPLVLGIGDFSSPASVTVAIR